MLNLHQQDEIISYFNYFLGKKEYMVKVILSETRSLLVLKAKVFRHKFSGTPGYLLEALQETILDTFELNNRQIQKQQVGVSTQETNRDDISSAMQKYHYWRFLCMKYILLRPKLRVFTKYYLNPHCVYKRATEKYFWK